MSYSHKGVNNFGSMRLPTGLEKSLKHDRYWVAFYETTDR
jgi:hypothetical protein